MLEEAHHFELTKDTLRADQALENVGELFEGYSLTVTRVGDRPDHSKSSIANGPVRQIVCSIASRSWKEKQFQIRSPFPNKDFKTRKPLKSPSNLTIVVVRCLLLLLLLLLLKKGRGGQDGLTVGGPGGPRGTGGHRRCCRPLMEHVKCPLDSSGGSRSLAIIKSIKNGTRVESWPEDTCQSELGHVTSQ